MRDNSSGASASFTHWVAVLALILAGTSVYLQLTHGPGGKQPTPSTGLETPSLTSSDKAIKLKPRGNNAFSSLIADVAQQLAPAVVNIDVSRTQKVTANPFRDDLFERFFGLERGFPEVPQERVLKQVGNGSGVIIDENGRVLTNYHVVGGADEIIVTLNDGRKTPARVLGSDPLTDLAVVQMELRQDLRPAALGDSKALRPGDWVLAIGSPLGFDHTVTLGIVSALSRQVPDINTNVDFIQTDAAINPGNSGGPLVDLQGAVIGINTAISGRAQNIGFAIPINTAKEIASALIEKGEIIRPWIGISMTELTPELKKGLGLSETTEGIVVAQVMAKSPAARAGFEQGDVIQRIDGEKIEKPDAVQDKVRGKAVGEELNFQVLRNGQMKALVVKTEALDRGVVEQSLGR